ncbi:hypothetical protein PCANC_02388 [Puccinia coronata f. sp. avenae]|uniref:Uncharacterized protein n=1 Tax=Puccinia coronata f. sp. avenae TaxID=200324 RepID=A0A2N5W4Z8_9BASI|nr:hypothetical protein PCANC_04346 [Puccinia coronata f. sp. avenae]PLW48790.1 hypothetical protein PCASD_03231 [Puccinia coronata f. sp. avenae]PLW57303.1 hypothetical protein PCANC_02388 [Puccinia coronata f. sp. avenae]
MESTHFADADEVALKGLSEAPTKPMTPASVESSKAEEQTAHHTQSPQKIDTLCQTAGNPVTEFRTSEHGGFYC